MAFFAERAAVVVGLQGGRATGPVAGALRMAYLAGACVVGAGRVELAYRRGGQAGATAQFKQIAAEFCDIFGVSVELVGKLDAEEREVRVANHTTYLDILVLTAAGAGRFLSMKQVKGWPLVGLVARRIGTIFVERDSAAGRTSGLKALQRAVMEPGAPVVIFPEGRTSRGSLLPFARGAFSAARSAGLRVRPLALVYNDLDAAAWVGDMELLPHVWQRLCGDEIRCTVRVLAPLETSGATSDELALKAQQLVAREVAAHAPS